MAWDQGLGSCLIPDAEGHICGRQIAEGEAIGTIVLGGPRVGHKKCADSYHARVQEAEREKRLDMVKRLDQAGPGGPVDPSTERDAVQGSIPLDRKLGVDPDKVDPITQAAVDYAQKVAGSLPAPEGGPDVSELAGLAAAAGVHNIADVPMDVGPTEAAAMAVGTNEAPMTTEGNGIAMELSGGWPVTVGPPTTSNPHYAVRTPSPLPAVRAIGGWVELIIEMPIESSHTDTIPFTVTLDPDDAEDLINILTANIKRAWRQR